MKRFFAMSILAAGGLAVGMLAAPAASASILIAQCIEFAPCWEGETGGVAFSDTVGESQLATLGLGSTQPFTAAQTSEFVTQLGPTTFDFTTTGAPVIETVGDFTGGDHSDPCSGYCEVDTVAEILIPLDATGLTVTGSFGGNGIGSSAGVNLFLGPAVDLVPEPAAWTLMLIGVGAIGGALRRRSSMATAA